MHPGKERGTITSVEQDSKAARKDEVYKDVLTKKLEILPGRGKAGGCPPVKVRLTGTAAKSSKKRTQ